VLVRRWRLSTTANRVHSEFKCRCFIKLFCISNLDHRDIRFSIHFISTEAALCRLINGDFFVIALLAINSLAAKLATSLNWFSAQ
jgi:hypothetical protein